MLSLKWVSSSKLEKKMTVEPGLQADLLCAPEMLVLSLQVNVRNIHYSISALVVKDLWQKQERRKKTNREVLV